MTYERTGEPQQKEKLIAECILYLKREASLMQVASLLGYPCCLKLFFDAFQQLRISDHFQGSQRERLSCSQSAIEGVRTPSNFRELGRMIDSSGVQPEGRMDQRHHVRNAPCVRGSSQQRVLAEVRKSHSCKNK